MARYLGPRPRIAQIRVGAGFLTIHAKRSDESEGRHRSEFRYGKFTRWFRCLHATGTLGESAATPRPVFSSGRHSCW